MIGLQIKGKYSWFKHLDFMIIDLIALFVSFVLSYWQKFGNVRFLVSEAWMQLLLIIMLLNILITLVTNPYSGIFRRSYYQEVFIALKLAITNLVVTSVLIYLFKMGKSYSREVFFMMYVMYFVLSVFFKYIWKKLLISQKLTINTTKPIPLFVISNSKDIERTINNISAGDFKLYDIKGIHIIDDSKTKNVSGIQVISSGYVDFILKNNINDVIICVQKSEVRADDFKRLIDNDVSLHVNVESILGFQTEDQYITNIGVYKTLTVGGYSFTPRQMIYLGVKRIVDIIGGLVGLTVLVPTTIGVKLANLAHGDKAKVFYQQSRIGHNGKKIQIWKYRSMVPNADEILKEMLTQEKYQKEWEEKQKFEDDPRITKVGRFIRKTSIDELPQLINVLVGDMSLVGPRPLIEGELEAHSGLKLYERVKPGITGWWGCNGRSNIDYRERLEMEYYYVKHCSLYLDILCIIRTIFVILKREGAK